MTEKLPDFTKLSDRVSRILGQNSNKFTLQEKPEYIPVLFNSIKQLGENINISDIIITHWHYDHVGGVDNILLHVKENNLPIPVIHKKLYPKRDSPHHQTIFHQINDNQIFHTEGATLQTIYTPGHSEDHLGFYLKEENAIFTGDSILGQGTTVFEDLILYLDSLEKMKKFSPNMLYPGHGPTIENGTEKIKEYIDHRMRRENQILEVFKNENRPLTPAEIVEIIYAEYPKSLWPAAERGVIIHLIKLEKENKVYRVDNDNEDNFKRKWALAKI
ncbi:10900_t:CDS:2 [Diversispora eburnea]|uniref:10900_t:CDS:1 n=1 Tax=Diversispora eburnea TaxID=1213867 RepID=A0A9N8UYY3_9GLOM|nr:10900_t:CDS:2 [Diversispora eburnea]